MFFSSSFCSLVSVRPLVTPLNLFTKHNEQNAIESHTDTATRLTILSVLEPHPLYISLVCCPCGWGRGVVSMINAFRSCFFTYCAPINVKPAGGGKRQGIGQGFGRSLWPGRAFELSCYLGAVIFDFLQTFDHNRGYIKSKYIRVLFVEVYN